MAGAAVAPEAMAVHTQRPAAAYQDTNSQAAAEGRRTQKITCRLHATAPVARRRHSKSTHSKGLDPDER
jgi:hypothetical protein